ncbi:MAG: nickel pincer cofactor biosynthesis protein LarC [Actinomycetota bacterium]
MRSLYIDVVGGAAGDMLLAALLDAGAPAASVEEAVSAVLGRRPEIGTAEVTRAGLRALALLLPPGLDEAHARRGPLDLLEAVKRAGLAEGVRVRASAVLARLGEAEARVHGVTLEEVRLDELGTDDTLVDVVGIAAALEALGVGTIFVSALPVSAGLHGGGVPHGGHGSPAPVTLELLRGFTLRPGQARDLAEPVTPTAAAVFAALGRPGDEIPTMRLGSVGTGAGMSDPAGVANVVRVLLGTPAVEHGRLDRRLLLVESNVDDLSPELVPNAIEALLSAGALDAWFTPIVMKRGRPALTMSALCDPATLETVRRAFFEATSTLGVRVTEVARRELERRAIEVDLDEGGPRIRVKVAFLDGRAISAKPEHADVVEAAAKLERPVRAVHEAASAIAHRLLEDGSSQ